MQVKIKIVVYSFSSMMQSEEAVETSKEYGSGRNGCGGQDINPTPDMDTVGQAFQVGQRVDELERINYELMYQLSGMKRLISELKMEREFLLERLGELGLDLKNFLDSSEGQKGSDCDNIKKYISAPVAVLDFNTQAQPPHTDDINNAYALFEYQQYAMIEKKSFKSIQDMNEGEIDKILLPRWSKSSHGKQKDV